MGDFKQALAISLMSLERWPDNPELLRHIADLYRWLGEYEQAISYYRQLLALEPSNAEIHESIGYSLAELKRVDEAIAAYKTALSLNPYAWSSHAGLALIYNLEHHYKEAIFEYEKALQLGEDVNIRASLCSLYHFEAQYQRAVDCFQMVIAKDPGNKVALNLLPYTLKNLRRKDFE
jgi:tetratricopeptide (TPR) repeat protein